MSNAKGIGITFADKGPSTTGDDYGSAINLVARSFQLDYTPPPAFAAIGLGTFYTCKYDFITHVTSAGSDLTTSRDGSHGMDCAEYGVFAAAAGDFDLLEYIWATETTASSVTLSTSRKGWEKSATSEGTFGIQNAGTSTNKYIFSSKASFATTAIGNNRYGAAGAGNTEMGIHAGGYPTTALARKYIFADDTVVAAPSLGLAKYLTAGCSNQVYGIIACGHSATDYINKYTYADNTMVQGTSASRAKSYMGCVGYTEYGVITTGSAPSEEIELYTWDTEVVSFGSNLIAGGSYKNGCSSVNGSYN